jgi:hypothetical protein
LDLETRSSHTLTEKRAQRSLLANPGRTINQVDTALDSPVSLDLGLSGGFGELAGLADPELCGIRDPLGAVRLPPDPFALLDVSLDGFRPNEASYRLATCLAVSIGGAAILDEHVCSLAVAPEPDLRAFSGSRGRIFFAESFLAAATSDEANVRRGMPLDTAARRDYARWDASNGHVFGLYDPQIHALIFTLQATPLNHEHVTLHELGHALTIRGAWNTAHLRADLLEDLPQPIATLLDNYARGDGREAVRERVLEALAEAYVWWVVGRWRELSQPLFGALHGLLTTGELRMVARN